MKHKHFTFSLDYFPIKNSNVFQNIKIQPKNKNTNSTKIGLKRFSIKNQINFKEIPEIMFFEKSTKKPKNLSQIDNFSPSSNQTKKSNTFSFDEIQWSAGKKNIDSGQKPNRVQSCPKPTPQIHQNNFSIPSLKNQIKCINLIDEQKQLKSNLYPETRYFQRNSFKNYQLESLEECQSEFDQSSNDSTIKEKMQCKTNNLRREKQILKSEENEKQMKKTKCTQSEKLSKTKKTEKSNLPKNGQNPESLSNKQKIKQRITQGQKQKERSKFAGSILVDQSKMGRNKFISLSRKSYYVIGSKSNKHRSLNKEKKTKNKSIREQANVILTNGDITENSTSIPSSNYRNSSTSSTVNYKTKPELSKLLKQEQLKNAISKADRNKQESLFQILRKTGEILDKYKGECIQLKKEKYQYQGKYEEAMKKLNRIKEELDLMMKSE